MTASVANQKILLLRSFFPLGGSADLAESLDDGLVDFLFLGQTMRTIRETLVLTVYDAVSIGVGMMGIGTDLLLQQVRQAVAIAVAVEIRDRKTLSMPDFSWGGRINRRG